MILERKINRPKKKWRLKKKLNYTQNNNLPPQSLVVSLPEDLIFTEILTRLPVNSLFRLKSVSKEWNFTISSPNFIKSHLQVTTSNPFVPSNCVFIKSPYYFYILNYGAYDRYPHDNHGEKGLISVKHLRFNDNGINTFLIGSCNGLVCFGRGSYSFRVYNPVMGHYYYHAVDPLGNFGGKLLYGFGFVSSKDDYRLFIGGLQRRSSKTFVYVHSLRFKEWKKVGAFDEAEFSVFWGGRGVLVNETLHWDMNQVWISSSKKCIVGFDLVNETFKYVPVPEVYLVNGHHWDFRLCEMGGSLCAWAKHMNGGMQIWMLKQYGKWDSWMKLFNIDVIPGLRNLYGCTDNGKVLVQTDEGSLLLADLDHGPPKYTTLVKDLGDIEVVSYVRSPVSPLL